MSTQEDTRTREPGPHVALKVNWAKVKGDFSIVAALLPCTKLTLVTPAVQMRQTTSCRSLRFSHNWVSVPIVYIHSDFDKHSLQM